MPRRILFLVNFRHPIDLRWGLSSALLALTPSPLWAIPSPDLVVNFVASAAQVLGLLTVVAGSFAYSGAKHSRARGATSSNRRWPFRILTTLLLVSVVANVLQYSSGMDSRNQRLQTNLWRSSTEAGKKVGDVNLKTLSISDQQKRPEAITTETLERWMSEKKPLNLIDVRESEEVEMGKIEGAWPRRYPDLLKDRTGLIVEGKETLLLCESGNRSGELCGKFLEEKLPCRFVIGGYEKWVAEGRPMVDMQARASGEIRDIPEYPRKAVLLDTPEVMALLESENALFVDVRYPGDFALGHLPDAVNLALRPMLSSEIEPALKALPKRPIVAPCYDKRSSFYAMILGLRLHRMGLDFRGRYTVPHEFAQKVEDKAWVSQWKEAQAGSTLLGVVSRPLTSSLKWLEARTGSLLLGIVSLVLVLRLLVLPLTAKADRDQLIQKRLAPQVKELKARLKGDPQRLSRAILGLYRKERLTLGRNLLGTTAQILLFIVFFSVVGNVAANSNEAIAWLPSLANPDPLHILPVIVGMLICVFLIWNTEQRTPLRVAGHVACGLLLLGITFHLKAAVNIYLATNLTLLITQSRIVRWALRSRSAPAQGSPETPPLEDPGIAPLRLAHRVAGAGNKAIRLGRMLEEGIPVPDGFIVTDALLGRSADKLELTPGEERRVSKAWRDIRAVHVAVRSSGLNEDGAQKSYAGVFESILNVPRERFYHALAEVHGSLRASRVLAYSGLAKERGGIVVQKMVPAEYAGVLFTEHPATLGCMLVELVKGLGDALVSGTATPTSFRYGRFSGKLLETNPPPVDLAGLIELGQRVEKIFKRPQDIEWAYAAGKFMILQARDITTSSRAGAHRKAVLESERHRILELAARSLQEAEAEGIDVLPAADPVVFAQNELSELLPRPTPLSLSFMESLWAPGGSTDLACRSLGIPYDAAENAPPLVNTIFGNLYVSTIETRRRLRRGPGAAASFKLARAGKGLEEEMRHFFADFLKEVRLREALDLKRLTMDEVLALLREWNHRFLTDTYVQAERINLAADFYLKVAKQEIEKRGLDPSTYLGQVPETVVHEAMCLLYAIQIGERRVEDFLALFGHRAPADYELSRPRYQEDPNLVAEMVSRARAKNHPATELKPPEAPTDRMFELAVDRACRFQVLKEEAKHHSLRELALIRRVIVEIGTRVELGADVFLLTLDETLKLNNSEFLNDAIDLVEQRKHDAMAFEGIRLTTELRLSEIESLLVDEGGIRAAQPLVVNEGSLRGTRVAGAKDVEGRVRVVTEPADIDSFERGEILVARFTDPTWTPLFPLAAGVITEVGGWLSHAAIVAREYNVTCNVGVNGAIASLQSGDHVQLKADGSVIKKRGAGDRVSLARLPSSAPVAMVMQGQIIEALLRTFSSTEAIVDVQDQELKVGQGLSITLPGHNGKVVEARVLRRHKSGGYAISFKKPLDDGSGPEEARGPQKN